MKWKSDNFVCVYCNFVAIDLFVACLFVTVAADVVFTVLAVAAVLKLFCCLYWLCFQLCLRESLFNRIKHELFCSGPNSPGSSVKASLPVTTWRQPRRQPMGSLCLAHDLGLQGPWELSGQSHSVCTEQTDWTARGWPGHTWGWHRGELAWFSNNCNTHFSVEYFPLF